MAVTAENTLSGTFAVNDAEQLNIFCQDRPHALPPEQRVIEACMWARKHRTTYRRMFWIFGDLAKNQSIRRIKRGGWYEHCNAGDFFFVDTWQQAIEFCKRGAA